MHKVISSALGVLALASSLSLAPVATAQASEVSVVGAERGMAASASTQEQVTLAEARKIILKKTNQFRENHGKRALKPMPALDRVAQRWTRHMANADVFEHNPAVGDQIPKHWRGWGENIAAGYDVESVVRAWIKSPGHRANLLGNYTHIGIGFAENSSSTYTRYYTQDFAKY